jgi:hypothetical protein
VREGYTYQIQSINPVTGDAVAVGRNLTTGEVATVQINVDTGAGFVTRASGETLPIRGGRVDFASAARSTSEAAAEREAGAVLGDGKGIVPGGPEPIGGPAVPRRLAPGGEPPISGEALSSQKLRQQLSSAEQRIDILSSHPDAPAMQRDLESIRALANRGREEEAAKLLKGLNKRVEAAKLSRGTGMLNPLYEEGEAETLLQPRDRPPGVAKAHTELLTRLRAGETIDITGFKNPPGDLLPLDPDYVPPGGGGLTNRQLAAQGKACWYKGQRVELHHRYQNPFGSLDEFTESFHDYVGEDPEFHPETSDPGYLSWRDESAIFEGERRNLGDIYRILRERYWKARFK